MMDWQFIPYMHSLIAATVMSIALALYAWRRRPASGAMSFALLMLAVGEYSLGYILELASADLPSKVFWGKVEAVGVFIIPAAWLVFTLQFTGRVRWLTRRNLLLLMIEPLVMLLLVWTNDIHGLIWSNAVLETSGSLSVLVVDFEVGALVHTAYDTLLTLIGMIFLFQAIFRSPHLYRGQIGALLLGALLPTVTDLLTLFGLNPLSPLDLMPFAFALTGLVLTWGLFRFRLLDIVPVARDTVIENMGDGVIVLDAQNRIVDLNPTAQDIVGCPASEAIGQPAEQVLVGPCDLVERYRDVAEAQAEIILGAGEAQHPYDLRISPLADHRGRLTGRLVVLRDITERKQAEGALRRAHNELEIRVEERTVELAKINEMLRAEIAERKRMEKEIKASLKEKEVLLKEIHHRVKNNLQIISSLLRLQCGHITDEQALKTLKESQNRVYSMATLHEILYQSEDLARVDFAEYTRKLVNHLLFSYSTDPQAITLKIQVAQVSLGVDTAISCGLIINELVSNSLKYAFPAGRTGEICIDLYLGNDDQLTLAVSDNGIGLPPDMEFRETESLGLQLATTLTEQLEGTIELDRSSGTTFKIVFSQ